MKEPELLLNVYKMKSATSLPTTIKTRIGYDDVEDYKTFIIYFNFKN